MLQWCVITLCAVGDLLMGCSSVQGQHTWSSALGRWGLGVGAAWAVRPAGGWSCCISSWRSCGWNKAVPSLHPSLTSAVLLHSLLPIHPIQSINISSYSVVWKALLYTLLNGQALFCDLWSWRRMKSWSSFLSWYVLNQTERYSFLLLVVFWLNPLGTFKSISIIMFLNDQVSFFFLLSFSPPSRAR